MTNLNQLLLGRFASMESDVVDNEEAQPVADAELGTDDLGNQLDSTTLPETAMAEADEHLDDVEDATADVEELNDTSESLESFLAAAQQVRKTGGWTQGEAGAIQLGLDAALKRIGASGEAMMPSLESFGRSRESSTASVENAITDGLKKIWEAIKRTINKVIVFIRKWYLKILDGASRLKKRAEAIRKKAENTTGSKKENKIRTGVISRLYTGNKEVVVNNVIGGIQTYAGYVSSLGDEKLTGAYLDGMNAGVDLIEAIKGYEAEPSSYDESKQVTADNPAYTAAENKLRRSQSNYQDKAYGRIQAGELPKAVKKDMQAWAAKLANQLKALEEIPKTITSIVTVSVAPQKPAIADVSKAKSPIKHATTDTGGWSQLEVERVDSLPGGKCLEVLKIKNMEITSAAELEALVKLSSHLNKVYIVSSADKAPEIDESKEIDTLDTGVVINVCDAVITFSEKVIDYKKGFEQYEKVDKDTLKKLDKISGKDLDKLNETPEIAKLMRGSARITSALISNMNASITSIISTGMATSSAALQYCVASLAQYKD